MRPDGLAEDARTALTVPQLEAVLAAIGEIGPRP
jgi:hypothetical protein